MQVKMQGTQGYGEGADPKRLGNVQDYIKREQRQEQHRWSGCDVETENLLRMRMQSCYDCTALGIRTNETRMRCVTAARLVGLFVCTAALRPDPPVSDIDRIIGQLASVNYAGREAAMQGEKRRTG